MKYKMQPYDGFVVYNHVADELANGIVYVFRQSAQRVARQLNKQIDADVGRFSVVAVDVKPRAR